jgi:hypothetical protein
MVKISRLRSNFNTFKNIHKTQVHNCYGFIQTSLQNINTKLKVVYFCTVSPTKCRVRGETETENQSCNKVQAGQVC